MVDILVELGGLGVIGGGNEALPILSGKYKGIKLKSISFYCMNSPHYISGKVLLSRKKILQPPLRPKPIWSQFYN